MHSERKLFPFCVICHAFKNDDVCFSPEALGVTEVLAQEPSVCKSGLWLAAVSSSLKRSAAL